MPTPKRAEKKRILIVEDEYLGALSLADLLGSWGYDMCEIAGTGAEAVRIAEKEKPDIVLMDVGLHGGMSGIEAAKKISHSFQIPVLFMSGYSEDAIRRKAELDCEFYFVEKPLDFEELKSKLRAILYPGKKHPGKTG